MDFKLGTDKVGTFLCTQPYTLVCKVEELVAHPIYRVSCLVKHDKTDTRLYMRARHVLPQAFSYEVGDMVVARVYNPSDIRIEGLYTTDTDTTQNYRIRFGKTIFSGSKDGKSLTLETGDGAFKFVHDTMVTTITATGTVAIKGDLISLGNGIAPPLNACTACPISGMHTSTVTDQLM